MDFLGALAGLLVIQNWLYFAPPAAAVLGLGALLAGWLKLKKGVKTNYTRKVFHLPALREGCCRPSGASR